MKPSGAVLVPIASESDARATSAALEPFLDGIQRIVAVHVIEKGGGAIDKAPLEKRRADAASHLAVVEERLGSAVRVDTRIAYGTDVVATIVDEAEAVEATAIAFRPRGGSRFVKLLTGDTASRLVTEADVPVVSIPDPEEA